MKTLNRDIVKIQSRISRVVRKASAPRQEHFDNVARMMGYADSNIAYKHLGKSFIDKAKVDAPSINIDRAKL